MTEPVGARLNYLLIRGRIVAITALCWAAVAPLGAARTFDLTTASIADIKAAFDAGALTSERLTQLYLARIAARLEQYRREAAAGTLQDQPYRSAVAEGRKIVRDLLDWTLNQKRLDAFIGPTVRPARLVSEESTPEGIG